MRKRPINDAESITFIMDFTYQLQLSFYCNCKLLTEDFKVDAEQHLIDIFNLQVKHKI